MPAAAQSSHMYMIGLRPEENEWVRLLVNLLRNPDPGVAELARQALLYLDDTASRLGTTKEGAQP